MVCWTQLDEEGDATQGKQTITPTDNPSSKDETPINNLQHI